MDKSPDAFRTISEVAEWLGVQTHVLRFWESKFSQVKPVKRAGGRRYYRPTDMQLLGGIKKLLHDDGMTIKGVQKLLREEGITHVSGFSQDLDAVADTPAEDVGENVVRFKARPEDAADAEPAANTPANKPATAAPEAPEDTAEDTGAPETPTEDEAPSPLPAFLTQPMDGAAAPKPAKPNIVDAPDPPAEDAIAVTPGALTAMAGLTALDGETAKAMAPLIGRLAVLRDRMAQAAG